MVEIKPLQKILFGSPGTGKSYKIRSIATEQLGIELDERTNNLTNTVKTVFHPEYTYADFVGKLMPQSQGGNVLYKFYPGHFLQILGKAYRGLVRKDGQQYLLVVDELNRGNASAIFGSIFQLLDRESNNWSSYEIDLSDLELMALFQAMGYQANLNPSDNAIQIKKGNSSTDFFDFFEKESDSLLKKENKDGSRLARLLANGKISIPPNLSIIATINTSDESIYYLDSAFKRRWGWEYIESPGPSSLVPSHLKDVKLIIKFRLKTETLEWPQCLLGINHFICSNSKIIRRIEDKQIGWWFIKPEGDEITIHEVKDKLMFYLWDSVFAKDRRPLEDAISKEIGHPVNLITFADLDCNTHSIALMKYFYNLNIVPCDF
jgi:5-methylcytosine-specific restriction enzyme B